MDNIANWFSSFYPSANANPASSSSNRSKPVKNPLPPSTFYKPAEDKDVLTKNEQPNIYKKGKKELNTAALQRILYNISQRPSWEVFPNDVRLIQQHIEEGADVNTPLSLNQNASDEKYVYTYAPGTCPLHLAAKIKTRDDLIPLLLSKGAKADTPNILGKTPLLLAVAYQNEPAVEALIKQGANVNQPEKSGKVEVDWAPGRKNGGQIRVEDVEGNYPLHDAVYCHKAALANEQDVEEESLEPIQAALLEILLRSGAEANVVNIKKETPLHCAIKNGWIQAANKLLDKDVELNSLDDRKESPLDSAMRLAQTGDEQKKKAYQELITRLESLGAKQKEGAGLIQKQRNEAFKYFRNNEVLKSDTPDLIHKTLLRRLKTHSIANPNQEEREKYSKLYQDYLRMYSSTRPSLD